MNNFTKEAKCNSWYRPTQMKMVHAGQSPLKEKERGSSKIMVRRQQSQLKWSTFNSDTEFFTFHNHIFIKYSKLPSLLHSFSPAFPPTRWKEYIFLRPIQEITYKELHNNIAKSTQFVKEFLKFIAPSLFHTKSRNHPKPQIFGKIYRTPNESKT